MSDPNPKIYLLPNLMTAGNLFCGFGATLKIVQGALLQGSSPDAAADLFHAAVWFILGACIFDVLDGRLARLGGQDSPFGREFDSLADIVSFGVAPALMVYRIVLIDLPRVVGRFCLSGLRGAATRAFQYHGCERSDDEFKRVYRFSDPGGGRPDRVDHAFYALVVRRKGARDRAMEMGTATALAFSFRHDVYAIELSQLQSHHLADDAVPPALSRHQPRPAFYRPQL